jgi:hypothetical protein
VSRRETGTLVTVALFVMAVALLALSVVAIFSDFDYVKIQAENDLYKVSFSRATRSFLQTKFLPVIS